MLDIAVLVNSIWGFRSKMWLLVVTNILAVGLFGAASSNVQAAVPHSPFLHNNSMLHNMSFNQHLRYATSIISTDFQERLAGRRRGAAPMAVSAAFRSAIDGLKNSTAAESALQSSLRLIFDHQQLRVDFAADAFKARAALARYIAHPDALTWDSHKFEIATRTYDVLSACTRSVVPNTDSRRASHTPSSNLPATLTAFASVAFVAAAAESDIFTRLQVWSLKSALMRGLAERIAFVGFSKSAPESELWDEVKHFSAYLSREDLVPDLGAQHSKHASPAAALLHNAGVWMHANHILMLPIQGVMSNLTNSATDRKAQAAHSLLTSRHTNYVRLDEAFVAALPNSNVTETWFQRTLQHAEANCTRPQCAPGAALAAAVHAHPSESHILPRNVLHFPGGSAETTRQALFFRGNQVHTTVQDGLRGAFAVAVPPGADLKRWLAGRNESTVLQGKTGLDLAVRHLLHTQPPQEYWEQAMRLVVQLTAPQEPSTHPGS